MKRLSRKRKLDALRRIIMDDGAKPLDVLKAFSYLEKLEAGKLKSFKPRGRPFKKKVVPESNVPAAPAVLTTPAQWGEELDARPIPSPFEQQAEQLRLLAESRKAREMGEEEGNIPRSW